MYEKKLPINLDCGLHLFLEVIQGKWKINLLWSIYSGIKRPGELHRKIPDATRRVLDNQLNQLIDHGLIKKQIYDGFPLKVEYQLTALGESLIPVIMSTAKWGEEHRNELQKLLKL
ncbi:transcriptional regulator [Chryseobacterium sp. T16E-39]|uniref:winged helix-turn-helix transcriptional regulator n=1 Tax=Chryseobacterium sp. T16E-39 TaxID=2015076 RepID=UPI000B5B337C|nr:helix-turn-helix domain-containing protein [Chryseobacterium sp. T16E-39]ASK28843.1 transcriptional regulator [Chryseobacterium sp. T16E-39]